MRPHHLRITAFGPYPGTVEVDLDELATGGLFLLHGATGAGKTSLLDAMCFALFGVVPGARGERRLRSDHADPALRTEVCLDLTVGGRRLRITRSPAYERPKKRGVGTTSEQPAIRVEELRAGAWATWSTRPGEADQEIGDLLGMTAAQFFQVVLLPQGQFAAFLRAKDAARAEVLERLFTTRRFRDAESWLADQRRAGADALTAARAGLDGLTARVAQAAGVEPPTEAEMHWYEATLAETAAALAVVRANAVSAAAAADTAAAEHRAAERTAERQARRDGARRSVRALTDRGADVDRARGRLAAARRAAPLVPLADRAARSRAAAAEAARLALGPAVDPADADRARARVAAIEAQAPAAARLAAHEARAGAADVARAQAAADRAALAERRAELPGRQVAATEAVTAALAATRQLPAVEATRARLAAAADDVGHGAVLRRRLTDADAALTDARERAVSAGETRLRVRTALLAGFAARLADDLVDGEACAVCGACEHPAPAAGGGDVPSEGELTRADAAAEHADAVRMEAAAERAAIAAELAAVEARVLDALRDGSTDDAGPVDPATGIAAAIAADAGAAGVAVVGAAGVTAALAAADRELTAVRLLAAGHDAAAAAAADLAGRASDLDAAIARHVAAESAAAATHAEASAAAAAERAALEVVLGGSDLATALAAARRDADALTVALEAAALAARSAAEADRDERELAAALAEVGLADAAALRRDALPEPVMAELAGLVEAYDAELAAAQGLLADPDLAGVPAEPVDTAAAGVIADTAARRRDELAGRAAVADERHRAVAALGSDVAQHVARLAPLQAEHAEVAGLADLTRGANRLGMTLSTYVLAARLEQVAATASARLLGMTDGRYTVRHSDDRVDRRSRGGLGLVVHDAWTGLERDTCTLSGGETFVASLALALGLADTVTAEAGGAPIEALFVDEGFGSLDEDTLEEVLDVLDGLRAGGRVVGVVSHVADLRRRIPAQLRVAKTRTGSTLERVG